MTNINSARNGGFLCRLRPFKAFALPFHEQEKCGDSRARSGAGLEPGAFNRLCEGD